MRLATLASRTAFRIECVGGGRGAKLAETIYARTGASHAGHLMTKRAQRAHERKAHGAGGARNEYLVMTNSLAACAPSQALDLLVFECCPWRVPEADRQPVVGIHQADRDREIDQFLLLKDRAHSLERFIRDARL